ncbi:MAG TPA: DUF1080 domain-containing protein [Blastocatellia bacterium]|nr:DUF1080 domain-containing protein [Blastocatellia bacterium]
MRTTLLLLFLTVFTLTAFAQKPNELTKAEKKAGWKLLFDGKTLAGWRGFHQQTVPEDWTVEDGAITKVKNHGEKRSSGGDIITVEQFDNFEFSFEWKLNKAGNSGVKYLVSESLPATGKAAISFEYQVLDDDGHPDAKAGIAGNRKAGSLYDLIPAPSQKPLKPIGEFNQSKIVVKGNHIEHWLNGQKMLEYERGSDPLKQRIAESKFKTTKGFGETAKGHILLQDHGDQIWFRNLKIRQIK